MGVEIAIGAFTHTPGYVNVKGEGRKFHVHATDPANGKAFALNMSAIMVLLPLPSTSSREEETSKFCQSLTQRQKSVSFFYTGISAPNHYPQESRNK
jgi:hypothetical protein